MRPMYNHNCSTNLLLNPLGYMPILNSLRTPFCKGMRQVYTPCWLAVRALCEPTVFTIVISPGCERAMAKKLLPVKTFPFSPMISPTFADIESERQKMRKRNPLPTLSETTRPLFGWLPRGLPLKTCTPASKGKYTYIIKSRHHVVQY